MTEPEPSPPEHRPERPPMRIGHAEREESAQVLAEHFSHGRIDGAEYEERVTLVWAARTTVDLGPVFADLPGPHPAVLLRPENSPATPPTGGAMTPYGPPAGLAGYPGPVGPPAWGGHTGAPTYGAAGLPAPGYSSGLPAYGHPQPFDPAPYGREPGTGAPYSDKSKVTAGVLQLFLGGAGIGRFYTGHTAIAVAQLIVTLVTFGLGAVWGFVDGIVILASRSTDDRGRPLRP
ncbi:DUF1707 domain-containing protein [Pseudonocardia xishanensis]|uniref:DUF1707 domain-containing protein n=1 Tax=Pseudonocardia xishanensis TaxID=630995 RepID=UPI0031EFCC4D